MLLQCIRRSVLCGFQGVVVFAVLQPGEEHTGFWLAIYTYHDSAVCHLLSRPSGREPVVPYSAGASRGGS